MALAPVREPTRPAEAAIAAALRKYWGFDQLRPLQREAIDAVLAARDSLVVLPTGGGKSLCYQVPAAVAGRTDVVVSPLISLMKDQVDGLRAAGYPAAALHSGISEAEKAAAMRDLLAGKLRLIFVAPERLLMPSFLEAARRAGVRAFHIDEAHCISQWGHDFRPEYRRLRELRRLFPEASLHAYTATATPRVRGDIAIQLGLKSPAVLVGIFDRPNLSYHVLPKDDPGRQVLQVLERHKDEAVIVYCISRKETEEMSAFLRDRGVRAAAYHAGMTSAERTLTQERFASERLDVVVATVAFGMGIDRSNVRCVIHTGMPKSIEHYQQETGRAGRDGLEAECVLLFSGSDVRRWMFIMDKGESAPEVLEAQKALMFDMRRLAETPACRHAQLSRYFGQKYETQNCGACDICKPAFESASDPQEAAWSGVDKELFERLRMVRRRIADERQVPPFVIMSDATLRELAKAMPRTLGDMRRVKGIGEKRLADLGPRFTGEIVSYCRSNNIAPKPVQTPLRPTRAESRQEASATILSLTKRRAFDLFREGQSISAVAEAIGRAPSTTAEYLSEFIREARPESVAPWVAPDVYDRVAAAAREAGLDYLKPVFDALGGSVSYEDIRVAMAHLRARAAASG